MEFKLKDIEMIYHGALERKAGQERSSYLDSACRGESAVRAHVEALLKANDEAGGFLEGLAMDETATWEGAALTEGPGTTIDRYKLLERIGEGGMAVVYMAEQQTPIHRRVALKIIKLGMDTRQVIARFEAERQALALMDHPNIARVFDAGATETGRPYFVMELVRGASITEYCDKYKLTTRQRLELFVQVCNAVQHAHQKGIIHRDIKPSNVMVTLHDSIPVPKVIDFGIAKATNFRLTEKTVFTRYSQMIGTPAYMSPEQAEMSGLDIDTRTDIYSLGVLLYELLTGTTPFAGESLLEAGYAEMQRIIQETDPLKPSTRIRTLGETVTQVAQSRQVSPEILRKLVRGDLDWIVMKTLEKDRTRRYGTAHALAEDIERHLHHEPIAAASPGAIYRVRKFVRRHRVRVIASLAAVVFTVGLFFAGLSYFRFAVQRTRGEHQAALALVENMLSQGKYQNALSELRPILSSRYVGAKARLLNARVLLEVQGPDAAIEQLRPLLGGQPQIAANAHFLLASIYLESAPDESGMKSRAEIHLRQGERLLPKTAEAYLLRAMTAQTVERTLGWLNDALDLDPAHYAARRARALARYALGEFRTMETEASVMIGSQPMNPDGYALRAIARRQMALAGNDSGLLSEAIVDHDRATGLSTVQDKRFVELCNQRRETLMRMGRYERALADVQTCVRLQPKEAMHRFHLFCILAALGDYEKAQAEYKMITESGLMEKLRFDCSVSKYVFDSLWAGRPWYPQGREPEGEAFVAMHKAADEYRQLAAKATRIVAEGFHPSFSPDGTQLAYSRGVLGASGIEILDLNTSRTRLLTVPGKDPAWSPDGKYIAYVRDRQVLPLEELTGKLQGKHLQMDQEEIWITGADGTDEPRFLAKGGWPNWNRDSSRIYYHSRLQNMICSVSTDPNNADLREILSCKDPFPVVSPDEKYVAFMPDATTFQIVNLTGKSVAARWTGPYEKGQQLFLSWSPDGRRLGIGCFWQGGFWIYDVGKAEASKVVDGSFSWCSWPQSGDGRMAFEKVYSQWHHEIWMADPGPGLPENR